MTITKWYENLHEFIIYKEEESFFKKWIEELRSGNYIQGKDYLMQFNKTKDTNTFCALGVAAYMVNPKLDILNKMRFKKIKNIQESNIPKSLLENKFSLFISIIEALNDEPNSFFRERYNLDKRSYTFEEIADYLEDKMRINIK